MEYKREMVYKPGTTPPDEGTLATWVPQSWCSIHPLTWTVQAKDKYAFCGLCTNKLEDEAKVLLLINNYQLFPNTVVHQSCADEYPNLWDMVEKLAADYKEFESLESRFPMWAVTER